MVWWSDPSQATPGQIVLDDAPAVGQEVEQRVPDEHGGGVADEAHAAGRDHLAPGASLRRVRARRREASPVRVLFFGVGEHQDD